VRSSVSEMRALSCVQVVRQFGCWRAARTLARVVWFTRRWEVTGIVEVYDGIETLEIAIETASAPPWLTA